MLKKNKKAGTHVGVILSFVIFVSFLIFMMFIIQPPTKETETKTSALEILKTNLEKEISVDTTIVFINNQASTSDCIYIEESSLDLESVNSSVKKANEEIIESKRENGNLYFKNSLTNNFFKIIYSPENLYSIELVDITSCEIAEIKSVVKKQEAFESKIKEILNFYETNYTELKETMNLAHDEEFSIQFEYSNGTTLGQNSTGRKTDVFSNKFQIVYLDEYSDINIGNFIVSIW